ncbi:MAG: hypothetical protein AAF502_08110 [Bacteroidota bacterium]
MTNFEYFSLLYFWVIILTFAAYYIAKRFLSVKRKVSLGPHYPFVKAMSILLIAFSIRHGMAELIFPLAMDYMGAEYTPPVYQNSKEAMVFYVAVMLIAISYANVLGKQNN